MGKRIKRLGAVLGLALVLSLAIMPSAVLADDVTYNPTEDTYIREDFDESNFGSSSWLSLCNDSSNTVRSLIRIDDQSGGGQFYVGIIEIVLWRRVRR